MAKIGIQFERAGGVELCFRKRLRIVSDPGVVSQRMVVPKAGMEDRVVADDLQSTMEVLERAIEPSGREAPRVGGRSKPRVVGSNILDRPRRQLPVFGWGQRDPQRIHNTAGQSFLKSNTSSNVPVYFSAHRCASVAASINCAVMRRLLPARRTLPSRT